MKAKSAMPKLDPHQERLLSYLDGELDAARRVELESELDRDPGLRAELDRQIRLRDLLAAAPSALDVPSPGDLAFERIRRNIHAQIDADLVSRGGAATATSATIATGSASHTASGAQPAPGAQPASGAPRSSRGRIWAIGGLVLAAAAAVAIVVSIPPGSGSRTGSGTVATGHPPSSPSPSRRTPEADTNRLNGTEIVRVEFGKMSGTYWEQSDGDDRVAVVWIDDSVLEEVGRP